MEFYRLVSRPLQHLQEIAKIVLKYQAPFPDIESEGNM